MFSALKREFTYLRDVIRVLRYVKDIDPQSSNLLTDDLEAN